MTTAKNFSFQIKNKRLLKKVLLAGYVFIVLSLSVFIAEAQEGAQPTKVFVGKILLDNHQRPVLQVEAPKGFVFLTLNPVESVKALVGKKVRIDGFAEQRKLGIITISNPFSSEVVLESYLENYNSLENSLSFSVPELRVVRVIEI